MHDNPRTPHRFPRWFAGIFALVVAVVHLLTLASWPLPWYDEVFFAGISRNWMETGHFHPAIAAYAYPQDNLDYGPAYFVCAGSLMKLFGVGIWQARLANFCFYLLLLHIFYGFLRAHTSLSRQYAGFATLALALDPVLYANAHSGRMDSMAAALALGALVVILPVYGNHFPATFRTSRATIWPVVLSAVLSALGLLTTPRVAIMLLPVSLLLAADFLRFRRSVFLYRGLLWTGIVLLLYGSWIRCAFGGWTAFLQHYAGLAPLYIGGGISLPKQDIPVYLLAGIAVTWSMITLQKRFFTPITTVTALTIAGFYVVVQDTGFYSVFILPFIYYLLAFAWDNARAPALYPPIFGKMPAIRVPLALILGYTVAFFAMKAAVTIAESSARSPQRLDAFLQQHLPPKSNVVGYDVFYYSATRAGAEFQYYLWHDHLAAAEPYHRRVFRYDYLLLSPENTAPEALQRYGEHADLQLVAALPKDGSTPSWAAKLPSFLRPSGTNSYEAALYKRISFCD